MYEEIEVNSLRWFDLTPLKNEIFRDVKEYEGYYQISNYGRLKSLERKIWNNWNYVVHKEKIIKARYDNKGYIHYTLYKNNIGKNIKAHKLVLNTFVKNINNKPQINHKNGIKHDNRLNNLEYCTNKENQIHAIENGLKKGKRRYKFNKTKKEQRYFLDKYRDFAIKKSRILNSKAIIQYDLNGNFIKTWNSLKDAERFYNKRIHIEREKSINYIWKKEGEIKNGI